MSTLKISVENVINNYKDSGNIITASVYLKKLNTGEWISIDGDRKFSPGSLMKIPILITFMKMNEKKPGILDSKILFDKPIPLNKTVHFFSKQIQLGSSYTVRELLFYMIAYSDNNATLLLCKYIDIPTYNKMFADLGLVVPNPNASDYLMSVHNHTELFLKLQNILGEA
jgi:beta-lactamase class A